MSSDVQWAELKDYYQQVLAKKDLSGLFADAERFEQFSIGLDGLLFDYSKQHIDQYAFEGLLRLAQSEGLEGAIQKLISGRYFNKTEERYVCHTALRWSKAMQEQSMTGEIDASLSKMYNLSNKLRERRFVGATGKPITDVVNIGVGGSDLGPRLVTEALMLKAQRAEKALVNIHFVASMDGSELWAKLPHLDPEQTLFIVASKSFSTIDTFANLSTARAWLGQRISNDLQLAHHLIGVSADAQAMSDYGLPEQHQLHFWNWVGGRFSLWSAIGLPVAVAIGEEGFSELLKGACAMDQHFSTAPFAENIPVIMGLLGIWNRNIRGINNHVHLPYDGRLSLFSAYMQQLKMESNGKSATMDGEAVVQGTSPIVWGGLGTNAQHAFFQWLHQGTSNSVADFVTITPPDVPNSEDSLVTKYAAQKRLAFANCISQSRLLAFGGEVGDNVQESFTYHYPGNTASSTYLLSDLTPYNLGMLLAAYEHQVFVESVLWGINAFDQPGVELGKKIANTTLVVIEGGEIQENWDPSTEGLLKWSKIIH